MKARPFTTGLQLMFTPEALIPFLFGSLALAILGNALYELLTNLLGTSNSAILTITVGALLVVVGMAWFLSQFLRRLRPSSPLLGKQQPQRHKGLILLVSNESTSRKAIEWHREVLQHCWLICSTQSAALAERLKQELIASGKKVGTVLIEDVFDPLEFREKVESVFSRLPGGLQESDVILDFTGMTACASVGSVLACLNDQREIQYTPGQYDATLKAIQPLDPVQVVLHWQAPMLSSGGKQS